MERYDEQSAFSSHDHSPQLTLNLVHTHTHTLSLMSSWNSLSSIDIVDYANCCIYVLYRKTWWEEIRFGDVTKTMIIINLFVNLSKMLLTCSRQLQKCLSDRPLNSREEYVNSSMKFAPHLDVLENLHNRMDLTTAMFTTSSSSTMSWILCRTTKQLTRLHSSGRDSELMSCIQYINTHSWRHKYSFLHFFTIYTVLWSGLWRALEIILYWIAANQWNYFKTVGNSVWLFWLVLVAVLQTL